MESPCGVGDLAVVLTSPTDAATMVTAGSDAVVRVWDVRRNRPHRVVRRSQLYSPCTAGCFSPDGECVRVRCCG